jgi:hypothetical protein
MSMFDYYIHLPTPDLPLLDEFPDDFQGIYTKLLGLYLSHESVSRVAHQTWENEGRPDGEAMHSRFTGMRVREVHWWHATIALETAAWTDAGTVHDLKWMNGYAAKREQNEVSHH